MLSQLAPFKLSVTGMVIFHPSMNYTLCMNEQWLSNAWVCVFLRLATVQMHGFSLWNDCVVVRFESKRIGLVELCIHWLF
jgi:hypothetical protein